MDGEQIEQIEIFYQEAYPVIDNWCTAAVGKFGTGCRAGCTDCCHIILTMTYAEAAVVLLTDEGRRAFEANRERLVRLSNLFYSRSEETKVAPWAKRKEPCPFLGDDGRCVVYERRPFNCRTHIAIKSCEPGQDGNLYVDTSEVTQVSYRLAAICSEASGIPMVIAPMPVALLMADAFISASIEDVKRAYSGTPFMDLAASALFWYYIET